jgi:protein-S-isoprenylcysteine O-methyltransferase Ste14
MKTLNRVCHHLYVIALLMATLVLLLAPLHLHYTVHAPIAETLDQGRVRFLPVDGQVPRAGASIYYFRYSGEWVHPVGRLKVLSVHPTEGVLAQAVDRSFRFPLGTQGTVTWQSPDHRKIRVNVGRDAGLAPNTSMQLFRNGRRFASALPTQVNASDAELEIQGSRRVNALGAQASIYIVENSVSYVAVPWLLTLELVACIGLVLLLLFRAFAPQRWERVVRLTRATFALLSKPRRFWVFVLSPVFLYFGVRFLLRSWDHVVNSLARLLKQPWLSRLAHADSDLVLGIALAVAATAFLWVFGEARRSPWAILREKTRYVPPTYRRLTFKWFDRSLVVWLLQVVIVYAFSNTLVTVLRNNTVAMAALAFPEVSVKLSSPAEVYQTVVQLMSVGPTHTTWAVSFQALNLLIFSVTIVGSLVGYLYGVVSIVWGKECVRNVDFTLTGWLVNALCYGPLLGVALWGMMPHTYSGHPGIVDGPIHYVGLVCGLLLNLLYSFSIYNMWTRFGVMVDKGMVTNLMFSVVRHPCYTLEGVMFAVLGLGSVGSQLAFVLSAVHVFNYWLRSERDEDFMSASNEQYEGYRQQVTYKYLPGLI